MLCHQKYFGHFTKMSLRKRMILVNLFTVEKAFYECFYLLYLSSQHSRK